MKISFYNALGFMRNVVAGLRGLSPSRVSRRSLVRRGIDYRAIEPQAERIATVYRCVDLISSSVASLPFRFMRRRGSTLEEFVTSPLHFLLTCQPDSDISAYDFKRAMVQHVLLTGNAYIVPEIDPATLELRRLALCDPHTVSYDSVSCTYHILDPLTGIAGTYEESDIIHVIGNTFRDRRVGVSVLEYARLTMQIGEAGDNETLDRFTSGGAVRGFVGNAQGVRGYGEYADDELDKEAEDVDSFFRSGGRIKALPAQVSFSPISLSAADMQFLESRKFTVLEICRFFGVHPSFVYADTATNYKSAEMANVAFLSNTLNPWLLQIENEFNRKLIPASLTGKRLFSFDRKALYAADLASKAAYQKATIETGVFSINYWRAEEGLPPVEGGDTVLVSANLKPLGALINETNPPSKEPELQPGEES